MVLIESCMLYFLLPCMVNFVLVLWCHEIYLKACETSIKLFGELEHHFIILSGRDVRVMCIGNRILSHNL